MKNGFERSCFDSYHFDFIDHDSHKLRLALDSFYSQDNGNGILDNNHLTLVYGASSTLQIISRNTEEICSC